LAGAFKNPVSSVFAVLGLVGAFIAVKFTLEQMLGLDVDLPFEYVQGKF
jgi:hypothetical protein